MFLSFSGPNECPTHRAVVRILGEISCKAWNLYLDHSEHQFRDIIMYLSMNHTTKPCWSTLKITKKLSLFQDEQIGKCLIITLWKKFKVTARSLALRSPVCLVHCFIPRILSSDWLSLCRKHSISTFLKQRHEWINAWVIGQMNYRQMYILPCIHQ